VIKQTQTPPSLLATAPVVEVVVLEDRAHVTRAGVVGLDAGRVRVRIADVTPLLAERSLRCRVQPVVGPASAASAKVIETQVVRHYQTHSARSAVEQELRHAILSLDDSFRSRCAVLQRLLHEREQLKQTGKLYTEQVSERLAVGAFDSSVPGEVQALFARQEHLEAEALKLQWQLDDERVRLDRLYEELAVAVQPVAEYRAELVVELQVDLAGEYELRLDYLVACAVWRPSYVAELCGSAAGADARLTVGGTVWQATGEDWHQVRMSLSTARPSLGAQLPQLCDDLLTAREKSDAEKQEVELVSRDEEVVSTRPAGLEKKNDTPPGVDDGGEARTLQVRERVTLPCDGRPHRLVVEVIAMPATLTLRAVPSRAPWVFLRSLQTNTSRLPLLAGPVTLLRNGGFVGRSALSFVAPQESFELSWGSEDNLVVLREEHRREEETLIRKAHEHRFDIQVRLTNHTAAACAVELCERIPVSELEAVKVDVQKEATSAGFVADSQGRLTWQVPLAAHATAQVHLAFVVRMPKEVHWQP